MGEARRDGSSDLIIVTEREWVLLKRTRDGLADYRLTHTVSFERAGSADLKHL